MYGSVADVYCSVIFAAVFHRRMLWNLLKFNYVACVEAFCLFFSNFVRCDDVSMLDSSNKLPYVFFVWLYCFDIYYFIVYLIVVFVKELVCIWSDERQNIYIWNESFFEESRFEIFLWFLNTIGEEKLIDKSLFM